MVALAYFPEGSDQGIRLTAPLHLARRFGMGGALRPLAPSLFMASSGVPRNFVRGGGVFQQIHLRTEDRENGDLEVVAPYTLVKGSGDSCNLVQKNSFHMLKFS